MGDRQSLGDLKPFLAKRIDRHSSVTARERREGRLRSLFCSRSRMAQNLDRVVFIRELEQ